MTRSPSGDDRDTAELQRFGYAQQLLREMGGFSSFALSFSVISILTGCFTLYGHGLRFGGPRVMGLGWPLVSAMTLLVAASLAELASAFPTAGALYHWSSLLGGRGAGFVTAWMNLLGQVAITAGIDFGLAQFAVDLRGGGSRGLTLGVYLAVLISHGIFNHVGVRWVARLNGFSAVYHLVGTALLVGALLWFGLHHGTLQPPSFFFRRFTSEPYPYFYGFLVGLLQAQWTFTGYDASAHVTEETRDPRRVAPWGMVLSVGVSGVVGYALLYAVTASIGDLERTAAAENPFLSILRGALPTGWAFALLAMGLGAMWFCGLASVTSNSRMLFAFARDGGLPGSRWLATVSPRFQSPAFAIWVSCGAAFLIALGASTYALMGALSTSALYTSYGLPIAFGLWARWRGRWTEKGPWNLGRASRFVALGALAWIAVILILFSLPPNFLSAVALLCTGLALAAYWWLHARRHFRGPPVGKLTRL